MPGYPIRIDKVARRYGDVEALRELACDLDAGRWVSLVGPSGSGKSTLLHLLGAMDAPSAGRILVGDIDLSTLDQASAARFRRERVGFVFQQHHMVPYLSAVENVMLAQWFHSLADEAEAEAALARVGLAHRARHLPSQLSGGERQRACIARALVNEPGLLLLDEPTGSLDWANALQVLDLLARLHAEAGFTIVCATHNPAVARWGDRVLTMRDGALVSDERIVPERPRADVALVAEGA
ncbi:ABC transporter ATP-binding protein [Anaeromyxobacter oryzisoli]|uniref:ABC transporter ATP-binding protein n=1 Tax=Anaeromyxobacter oryzisoli TaxID=2925408 RepID=UPI001F568974|nr:ABC transporter ATP-binding protein [Anaeromyxobacter sp. SG63]